MQRGDRRRAAVAVLHNYADLLRRSRTLPPLPPPPLLEPPLEAPRFRNPLPCDHRPCHFRRDRRPCPRRTNRLPRPRLRRRLPPLPPAEPLSLTLPRNAPPLHPSVAKTVARVIPPLKRHPCADPFPIETM
jgi:hypothetical protein